MVKPKVIDLFLRFLAKNLRLGFYFKKLGIRYKLTEQAIRNKLIKEMEAESCLENDYFDEATNFVSEARERFSVPGFVHQPPRPTVVRRLM